LYTGENDTTWLEHSRRMDLDMKMLDTLLSRLSSGPISDDLINSPPSYLPIFMDHAERSKLLKMMPTLDDIDVTVWHIEDASWAV
jgi:hypothetical protein